MTKEEIEITPEMEEAGIKIYWEWHDDDNYHVEDLARAIYRGLQSLDPLLKNRGLVGKPPHQL